MTNDFRRPECASLPLLRLKREDFEALPKGVRGVPVYVNEAGPEVWPEPEPRRFVSENV